MRNTKKLLFCVLFTLLSVFVAQAQYTGYDYVATDDVTVTPVSYIDMQGAEHVFIGASTPASFTDRKSVV